MTFSDINMAKLKYSGGSIWSPLQFDPATTLVFIQTDRKMYAEKEEGESNISFSCKSYFLDYVRFHQWFFSVLVKLRIVVVLPSLKPYSGQFNVEIIVRVVFI